MKNLDKGCGIFMDKLKVADLYRVYNNIIRPALKYIMQQVIYNLAIVIEQKRTKTRRRAQQRIAHRLA